MEASLSGFVVATLLLGLRVAPVLAFAPPFTLTRLPAAFRLLFGFALAGLIVSGRPTLAAGIGSDVGSLVSGGLRELGVSLSFIVALQMMFAALYVAGRTVDIQAGFGLAGLIDPTSQAQTPLVGSILVYAAALVFFSLGGLEDLLRILAASLDTVPLRTGSGPVSLARLGEFVGSVFALGFGVAGSAILTLFVADSALAMMSRTLPQMNIMVLGFQVKVLLLLVALPLGFGLWAALMARMVRLTLQSIPRLL